MSWIQQWLIAGLKQNASVTYATFNASDKDASITLSWWNLIAKSSVNAWRSVRWTISKSSWKWYWEYKLTTRVDFVAWIAKSTANLRTFIWWDANGWGYSARSWNKFYNWSWSSYGAIVNTWDIVWVALDMDNWTITFYKNNVSQWIAFSWLTGSIFAWISLYWASWVVCTANFWATAMTYTAPTWYNQGLYN